MIHTLEKSYFIPKAVKEAGMGLVAVQATECISSLLNFSEWPLRDRAFMLEFNRRPFGLGEVAIDALQQSVGGRVDFAREESDRKKENQCDENRATHTDGCGHVAREIGNLHRKDEPDHDEGEYAAAPCRDRSSWATAAERKQHSEQHRNRGRAKQRGEPENQ